MKEIQPVPKNPEEISLEGKMLSLTGVPIMIGGSVSELSTLSNNPDLFTVIFYLGITAVGAGLFIKGLVRHLDAEVLTSEGSNRDAN